MVYLLSPRVAKRRSTDRLHPFVLALSLTAGRHDGIRAYLERRKTAASADQI
jgi:hypothetical protein